MTVEATIYRELYSFLSADGTEPRPHPASALDLPRPLARALVHLYGMIRSETLRCIEEDLADQIAASLARWFTQLWEQLLRNTEGVTEFSGVPGENARLRYARHVLETSDDEGARRGAEQYFAAYQRELSATEAALYQERALRLVTAPLADHLNDVVSSISATRERIYRIFGRPGMWNIFENDWNEIPWGVLESSLAVIGEEPELTTYAQQLIAGAEPAQRHPVWREFLEVLPRTEIREAGYGDIHDLTGGITPRLALPSELSLLAFPETEDLFARKLAEQSVLSLASRRQERVHSVTSRTVWQQVSVPERLGPVYLCIDTSGSMAGLSTTIGTAIALAVIREGLRRGRSVSVLALSDGLRVATFCDTPASEEPFSPERGITVYGPVRVSPQPAAEFAEILSQRGGGADISPALEEALTLVEGNSQRDQAIADIVVISDIAFPKIGPDHLNRIGRIQNRGWGRLHALTLGRQPLHDPLNIFDYRRHYNTAEEVNFRTDRPPRRLGLQRTSY